MKRVVYLAVAALVAMLILVPTAMAQEQTMMVEETMVKDLPKSGGPAIGSMVMSAAALLVGSGVLALAVLRRR